MLRYQYIYEFSSRIAWSLLTGIAAGCRSGGPRRRCEMVEIVLTLGLICGIAAGVIIGLTLMIIASGRLMGH